MQEGFFDGVNMEYLDLNGKIERIRQSAGAPYLDVVCYQSHKELFRYTSGEGVTGKELLYMYSCGKPVTVTAALRLVEEGKMALDDLVYKYLPEVKNAFILDEQGGQVRVGDKMTVRHLFTMTAGFTYDLWTKPILGLVESSQGKATLRDFIAKFVETPLSFAPGQQFQYSLCHDVLAAVVETVSGKRFSEYVNEVIFQPLKMGNSRFDNREKNVFDAYMVMPNGKIEKTNEGKILLPTPYYESGGAGLVSTAEDYIRFADALACGGVSGDGYTLLSASGVRALATEQVKNLSVKNTFTCVQGTDYGYGLGVRVRQTPTAWGLPIGEFGWDGAAGSYVMIDPTREVSVFIGMHLRNWPDVFTGKHLEIVETIYKHFFQSDER